MMTFVKAEIPCDMCVVAYELGQENFHRAYGEFATTLIVPPVDVLCALMSAQRSDTAPKHVTVVAVPGMPTDSWMLVGPQGVYYNEGA